MTSLRLLATLFMVAVSTSHAATLVTWNFNDGTTNASATAANLTAGAFTSAGGLGSLAVTANSTVRAVGDTGYVVTWTGTSVGSSGEAGAITGLDYFTFTLTPSAGHSMSIDQISFYAWMNTSGTLTDDYNYFVRSSATGATTLGTYTSALRVGNSTVPTTANQYTLNLSGVTALQNVTTATTFTIGMYLDNASTSFMRIDSVSLSGTITPVPEPTVAFLALSAAVVLIFRRRLHRQAAI